MSETRTRNIVVLGATSAIAEALARRLARRGDHLVLVGRDGEHLERIAADLRLQGAGSVIPITRDLARVPEMDDEEVEKTFEAFCAALPSRLDAVALFYGVLGNQSEEESDVRTARRNIRINFGSAAEWCLAAAARLEQEDHGVLLAVSSVAGDRGRQSNYVYGATKAGLTTLVQGIAHRLAKGRARAVVAKLGFVDTPMTAHIEKSGPLWATPDGVAARLEAIIDRPRAPVVYVPSFWRWIMLAIRFTPAPIFHRTGL